jgi:ribonuclease T2
MFMPLGLAFNRAQRGEAGMRRVWLSLVFALLVLGPLVTGPAAAQDRRQNTPGQFDYFVLALSWSPSFCEQSGDRPSARMQCSARPYSFVVHGLWPQYERGFPEFCQNPPPFVDNRIINAMLDLMPARPLVIHEWKKHGVCTGQSASAYFETVRRARAVVKIPEEYLEPTAAKTVSPDEVEEAFVKANPGMSRAGVAVICGSRHLNEVRVCMTRDLKLRECPEVDRRACRRDKLYMPPVRGG